MLPIRLMDVRAGFCAIVGLPNVGKSTLLNRLLGRRLVAVSSKPQTTRDRIIGVHTFEMTDGGKAQIAYVDTPGVQDGHGPLRRYMQRAAVMSAADADVVLMLVDATYKAGRMPDRLAADDTRALADASKDHPIIIALNKIDRVEKPELFPVMEAWGAHLPGAEIVPISAETGEGTAQLEQLIAKALPIAPLLFPEDAYTDRTPQFIAQEIIREQLYHQLGKELPYACAVQIEDWSDKKANELVISAVIVVERESQKAIVVGRAGSRIRELGIAARQALGAALGTTVHLKLFVKVLEEWSRGERTLEQLGYKEGAS